MLLYNAIKNWATKVLEFDQETSVFEQKKEEACSLSHDQQIEIAAVHPKEEPSLGLECSKSNGFSAELLNIGSIAFGKLWCNKQAIFPKGRCGNIHGLDNVLYGSGFLGRISR
ncbi:hypothetical protein HanXRQr2_Chr06g0253221 [Helianthus annuus]|uniref:Uncharacterized protein n=1 Tax=Helianthus annuus TaxID=4232 RepID=A0A9K3IRR7_HELAN|nr:hypothetical protein HanXRQr2_Chr06g0253221 [Helianthus annuus]KAJ0560119.1 hypothetical protein HanHA300_Chr06g0207941 [Helianthus annuus]KAJ0573116.1 hypothetical protein HanHA89_Chr06g0223241 [Helianthus annuus]